MAAGAQQGGEQGQSSDMLWLVAALLAVGLLLYYFFKDQMQYAFLWVRLKELQGINFFLHRAEISSDISSIKNLMQLASPLDKNTVVNLSTQVGIYLRWPIDVLLALFALGIWHHGVKYRFRNLYSMKTLSEQEQVIWPNIQPVLKLNLADTDINSGPWAMLMSPLDYCKAHNLLKIELDSGDNLVVGGPPKFKSTLLLAKTREIMSEQVGLVWSGWRHLSEPRRAVFALFICRIKQDQTSYMKLSKQFSISSAKGKLDISGVDEICKKYYTKDIEKNIGDMHAYELSMLASMLAAARDDGVVPSAEILWLKPVDRMAWYMLNAVGRQTPPVEVAGIFAHWLAEIAIHRPLTAPMIEEGVKALDLAMKEILYVPSSEEQQRLINEHYKQG